MILKQFCVGFLGVNNYLLIDEKTKEACLIDCTQGTKELEEALQEYGAKLTTILLTHGHFDHVLGVNEVREKYGAKSFINKQDLVLVENINQSMAKFGIGNEVEIPIIDGEVQDVTKIGELEIKSIHTPGHSLGGMCFLVVDCLFTGDTLFNLSVGRCDLYGGSFPQLKLSIEEKIFTLDEKIKVYPGHGPSSTVGYEKHHNEFL